MNGLKQQNQGSGMPGGARWPMPTAVRQHQSGQGTQVSQRWHLLHSLILLELQKGPENKLRARCLSRAGSSVRWRFSTDQSSSLALVGATGLLSIFQNEAEHLAAWLQIWELPSRQPCSEIWAGAF